MKIADSVIYAAIGYYKKQEILILLSKQYFKRELL